MKRTLLIQTVVTALLGLCVNLAPADLIVDHQPLNTGGLASDTLFLNSFNQPFSQRVADDFTLSEPQTIDHLDFWAFYDRDNPPTQETIRVRFYGARASDGLPDEGNLVYEENLSNPARTATGRHVLDGISPHEYLFQSSLAAPVSLGAGVKYWLEIVQIGDLTTHFRWEFSIADLNGQAFINQFTGDWRTTLPGTTVDTAFRLYSIPEPCMAGVSVLLLFMRPCRAKSRLSSVRFPFGKRNYHASQSHHCFDSRRSCSISSR